MIRIIYALFIVPLILAFIVASIVADIVEASK